MPSLETPTQLTPCQWKYPFHAKRTYDLYLANETQLLKGLLNHINLREYPKPHPGQFLDIIQQTSNLNNDWSH
jgi:hypothetical protein